MYVPVTKEPALYFRNEKATYRTAMWSNVYVMMTTRIIRSNVPLQALLVISFVTLHYQALIVSSTE